MAVSWGSVWCHVYHQELGLNGVILLDKYPSACGSYDNKGNEVSSVFFPDIEGVVYVEKASKTEAMHSAKLHKLKTSKGPIAALSGLIVDLALDIELLSFELSKLTLSKSEREAKQLKLSTMQSEKMGLDAELKFIKASRRSKITEFLERDLEAAVSAPENQI